MNIGNYIFTEVMSYIPRRSFDHCVRRYQGERYTKSFSCRDQFLALAFGQLAYARVRGVGATGDGSNQNVAIADGDV